MEAIATRAQTAKEKLDGVIAAIRRKHQLEEEIAKASGNDTPEAAKERDFLRAADELLATRNAERAAKEAAAAAREKLPGAKAAARAAAGAVESFAKRHGLQSADDAAEEQQLLEKAKGLESNLAGLNNPLANGLDTFGLFTGRGLLEGTDAAKFRQEGELADVQHRLQQFTDGGSSRKADLERATGRAEAAGKTLADLQAAAESNTQFARELHFGGDALRDAADFGRPPVNNIGPGSVQFKYDSQRASLQRQQVAGDASAVAKTVTSGLREIIMPMREELNELKRAIRGQSQQ